MFLKMLKADLFKKKTVTFVLFIFVAISAFLCASGAMMSMQLSGALNGLFLKTNAPHFVQMHEGILNEKEINQWANTHHLIKKMQIVKMLKVDGAHVYIGMNKTSEADSVMSIDFVTQNREFDFLLNQQDEVVQLSPGEIAVPIYYMQRYHLHRGDKIKVINAAHTHAFTIVDFVKDVQMNPSIIHSKRFLIHPHDFRMLAKTAEKVIYLIEFQLTDLEKLTEFSNEYQLSKLPKHGPTIQYHLFKALNAITDGIIIGMIIIVSLLLTLVAILCLRFAILATIEEEYRQIGIMKAIGMNPRYVQGFYLIKYVVVTGFGCVFGYIASLLFKCFFIKHIALYLGSASDSILQHIVPFFAVCLLFFMVLSACIFVLRKFNKISTIEALREGIMHKGERNKKYLSLSFGYIFNLNIFLGLREVIRHFRRYLLLFFVFIICSFVIIVPINFFNTLQSPTFVTYMGIERSDMRIDFQQDNKHDFKRSLDKIKRDKDVRDFAAMITSRFHMMNHNGSLENINIQTGDFSVFPLQYLRGQAPQKQGEIALSYLNSKDLKKKVGDWLVLIINGKQKKMHVCGVYQDITNGGKTAKAKIPVDVDAIIWSVINIAFKPQISIHQKMKEYKQELSGARVTDLNDYLAQTLGDFIQQIKNIALLTIAVAICISILITTLFLNLLIAKDRRQIAIMKAIGFSFSDIRIQYLVRTLLVLNLGIFGGAMISNTVGQHMVSVMWSFMGASEIKFIIHPLQIYVLCPLIFMGIVSIAAIASIAMVKKATIQDMVIE